MPRGSEERAVRKGLRRAGSAIRVVAHGIGQLAAGRAADLALGTGAFGTALSTGLCGLLSPSFLVGDALVYREMIREHAATQRVESAIADAVARAVPGAQTGIRALGADTVLVHAGEKRAAAAHFNTEAVDMESYALVERLTRAGVAVAVLRIGSDGVDEDLPELDRALDGSGGIDSFALMLAMLREPLKGFRLARNGMRALAALEAATYHIALSA